MVAWLKYGLLLTLGLSWGWAQAALVPVPALTSPVMDTANMLSTAEQQSLSAQLEAFAKANGSQIAVLTVATIEPETSFDYAVRVMADWQLGRKGVDDGVLLLLVRDERKSHIAVGRGLEGAIPDVYTKRILMDTLAPYLQEDHVYDGLMAATQQLQKLVLNEPLPEIQQEHSGPGLETAMMLVFFLWAFAGRTIKAIFGKTLGSLLSGGLGFGIALLIGLSLGFSVLIGLAVLGLSILVSPAILSSGGGGGFGGGGLGGGGFGGGGGGFSGGGGRFGGGGSSGSW